MVLQALLNDGMILSNLERKVMDSSRRFILLSSNAQTYYLLFNQSLMFSFEMLMEPQIRSLVRGL